FFSSRRRHTRFSRDWSSDVCSSDLLAHQFLRRAAEENEVEVVGFTKEAERALLGYPWPGNVRELQNAVEHAVILAESELVDARQLPIQAPDAAQSLRLMVPGVTLAELERFAITETLKAVNGSPAKAAEILGVSRRTIQYRMREYGLSAGARGVGPGEPPPLEDK